jgi:hypothetical protein
MALSSGVYSLIGVAVGAASTGGFQWWLAVRAERRERRAAKRHVARALADAIRTHDSLSRGASHPARLIARLDATGVVWRDNSTALAVALEEPAWLDVSHAFAVVALEIEGFATEARPTQSVLDQGRTFLVDGLKALDPIGADVIGKRLQAPCGPDNERNAPT